MKKKFIQFLKDNDALIPYITNVAHFNKGMTLSQAISHVVKRAGWKRVLNWRKISEWKKTTEGFNYWNDLNIKWRATFD
jgi:hypothetical protein